MIRWLRRRWRRWRYGDGPVVVARVVPPLPTPREEDSYRPVAEWGPAIEPVKVASIEEFEKLYGKR